MGEADASDDLEFLLSAELEKESPAQVPVVEASTSTSRFRASSKYARVAVLFSAQTPEQKDTSSQA